VSDLDVEVIEEAPQPDEDNIHQAYFDKLSTEEQRRYICLDMVRLFGGAPEKAVEHARRFEQFFLGKGVRGAVE
jgi:hypothetical protein